MDLTTTDKLNFKELFFVCVIQEENGKFFKIKQKKIQKLIVLFKGVTFIFLKIK